MQSCKFEEVASGGFPVVGSALVADFLPAPLCVLSRVSANQVSVSHSGVSFIFTTCFRKQRLKQVEANSGVEPCSAFSQRVGAETSRKNMEQLHVAGSRCVKKKKSPVKRKNVFEVLQR